MEQELTDDNLCQLMQDYLAPLYFPQSFDGDTIHTLARNEFCRVRKIVSRTYNFDESRYIKENGGTSPFDQVEDEIEQEVYSRIRKDTRLLQMTSLRNELTDLIRQAVEKENGVIGTFYTNRGIRYRDTGTQEEHIDSPVVAIQNTEYGRYGGYEGSTLYDLFIDKNFRLTCTFNGEAGEDFDEPIENVQIEGLVIITHWLMEHGFLPSGDMVYEADMPGNNFRSSYAAWQAGKAEMHITSINYYRVSDNEPLGGCDDVFYDKTQAMRALADYFTNENLEKLQDVYYICEVRLFAPPLEERQTYPAIQGIFDLSGFRSVKPYYSHTVNKIPSTK